MKKSTESQGDIGSENSNRPKRGQTVKVSGPLAIGKKGTFSRRLSERIDFLIEGQLAKHINGLVIPGLDDDEKDEMIKGKGMNLFGNDADDDFEILSAGSILKSAKSPIELKKNLSLTQQPDIEKVGTF